MEIWTRNELNRVVRHNAPLKRPKKAKIQNKGRKAKSEARTNKLLISYIFLTFLGSLGPKRMENVFSLNYKTIKATRRLLDSRIQKLQ